MRIKLKLFYLAISVLLFPMPALAAPLFDTAVTYELVGGFASCVVSADFDGDGDLDLAVGLWKSVAILKNNGNSTFAAPLYFEAGIEAWALATSDLDGDGDFDLAIANNLVNSLSILKNNGDGTFADTVNYRPGTFPTGIAAADFDRDGDVDLALSNLVGPGPSGYSPSLFLNNGDGTFGPDVGCGTSIGGWSIISADIDGDEDFDLINGTGAVIKSNGDGTFGPMIPWVVHSDYVFSADLDGDDDIDLAAARGGDSALVILKNDGNGSFTFGSSYPPTGKGLFAIMGADFDGDGDVDLVVADASGDGFHPVSTVSVFENKGDATFSPHVEYMVDRANTSVYPADLDGDGDYDLAVANREDSSVSVLKNLTNIPVCTSVKGDLNADGQPTVLDIVLFLNCVFLNSASCNPCLADVNCDGNLSPSDIVLELYRIFLGTPFPCS